jgi:hypothetical protein
MALGAILTGAEEIYSTGEDSPSSKLDSETFFHSIFKQQEIINFSTSVAAFFLS